MIEIINENRHVQVAVLNTLRVISLRIKLKGASFEDRQDTLRSVYNMYLVANNALTWSTMAHSRSIEVFAKSNNVERSVGFIPEEIVRVLRNNSTYNPTISGVEVRKHLHLGGRPTFGAVARLYTNIPSTAYLNIMKEFEASLAAGPVQEDPNADSGTRNCESTTTGRGEHRGDDSPTETATNGLQDGESREGRHPTGNIEPRS